MREEKDKIEEYYRLKRSIAYLRTYDKEACWERLVRRLKARRSRRIVARTSVAAAVLVAGLWVGLLYPFGERDGRVADAGKGCQPESGGVTLVLSDGERVDLNRSEGRIVAEGGNARISNADRRLTYEAGETADTAVKWNRLIVPRGGEYQVALADGTMIWLNAESELEYPEVFAEGCREVRLSGEAYFEVARDTARSFVVRVEDCFVKVLGTHFNVSAYPDEAVCATLAEGSVEVGKDGETRRLRPNEQAVVEKDAGTIVVREVDASQYISWIHGEYVFKNTPLEDVFAQLGRWYDVEFRFATDSLRARCMAGVVYRDEGLDFTIDVLERAAHLRIEQAGDTIYIEAKK